MSTRAASERERNGREKRTLGQTPCEKRANGETSEKETDQKVYVKVENRKPSECVPQLVGKSTEPSLLFAPSGDSLEAFGLTQA